MPRVLGKHKICDMLQIEMNTDSTLENDMCLLSAGWNEIVLAGYSYFSMEWLCMSCCLSIADGFTICRSEADVIGIAPIYDSLISLAAKMSDMGMDRTELLCLRAIILFKPGIKQETFLCFFLEIDILS